MFRRIRRRNPAIALKTGLMLGLGETTEELLDTLADLLDAGCRMLTLGQYLQPSPAQMPVVRYVPPEEFDASWPSWPGGSVSSTWPAARSSDRATTRGKWRAGKRRSSNGHNAPLEFVRAWSTAIYRRFSRGWRLMGDSPCPPTKSGDKSPHSKFRRTPERRVRGRSLCAGGTIG